MLEKAGGLGNLGAGCGTCVGDEGRRWLAAMHVLLGGEGKGSGRPRGDGRSSGG